MHKLSFFIRKLRNEGQVNDVFDVSYYYVLKKYLRFLGLYPYKNYPMGNLIVFFMVASIMCIILPGYAQMYVSVHEGNIDAVLECLTHISTASNGVVKILTMHLNKRHYGKLYDLILEEWVLLEFKSDVRIMDKITKQGYKIGLFYRSLLLSFLVIFIFVPVMHPLMDIVMPLNATRPRQQIFELNYIFIDAEQHFFPVYVQLSWSSSIVVVVIVTVDSMYMILAHHGWSLFAICGHQIQETAKYVAMNANKTAQRDGYERVRNCVKLHNKAIQFYDIMEGCQRLSMLTQVAFNMIGISVTAYQVTMYLDDPEQTVRLTVLFIASQFHLFYNSLPGQILADSSLKIGYDIYNSDWYKMPPKMQRMYHLMYLKSMKSCALTAGGLYPLDMEHFGNASKMCMSYFTMLLSLKE